MKSIKKYDYHTHNGYSGCASKHPYSVKDGWKTAQDRGLIKWGISNHYPTRREYGNYFPKLRKEVDAMENVRILLGVEMELEHEEGLNGLPDDIFKQLDYVIGSSHHQPMGFLKMPDLTDADIGEFFESYRNVLVNSLKRLPIDIWGHPFLQELQHFGDRFWDSYLKPIFEECLDICADKQIAIELTPTYHNKCQAQPTTFPVLEKMYAMAVKHTAVPFVTSSDSHSLVGLADLTIPLQYVKKFGITQERILEIEKRR